MMTVDDDASCSELSSKFYFFWRVSATLGVAVLIFVVKKLWWKIYDLENKNTIINKIGKESTNNNINNLRESSSPIIADNRVSHEPRILANGSAISEVQGLRRRKNENKINMENLNMPAQDFNQPSLSAPADKTAFQPCVCAPCSCQCCGQPKIERSQLVLTGNDGHVTEIDVGDWSALEEGKGLRQRVKIVTTLDIVVQSSDRRIRGDKNGRIIRGDGGGRPIRININVNSFAVSEEDKEGVDHTDLSAEKAITEPEESQNKTTTEPQKEQPEVNSLLEVANAHTVEEVVEKFKTLDSVGDIIREAGLESSNLIFGLDYTASNKFQGEKSFGGKSLHSIETGILNPYQQVISVLGKTLAPFANSGFIAGYGFGDAKTEDTGVFPLCTEAGFCTSFGEMLKVYNDVTPNVILSGPTNFAPLIYEAINICKQIKTYHILVIVADGQVTNELATKEAIVKACHFPLSIIMVGVGDGPWQMMKEFDESLPKRTWDNFHFIDFHKSIAGALNPDLSFSVQALMEIPDQYKKIKALGLLDKKM